ncbi:MAG: restriction endonuclease subunit S, partial [Bacteroidales bacterium]|nr:restriction endonuclease subunit S [Bacteroidales bacterium]
VQKQFQQKAQGSTVSNLNTQRVSGVEIAFPPLPDQQRIVTYLDAEFAKIEALKANAEKQLQAAKDLFQAALKELLTPKEGWKMKTIDSLQTDMYRGSGITREQIRLEGVPCVRYGEIYTTYNYWFEECVSHTDEQIINSKKYFEHGDILFAITGESVEDIGKSIAYLGHNKCLAGGDIIVMKHNQNPKYLAYALSTPDAIAQKGFGKTKLKVVHTNAPSLKAIVLPIPTLPEQQRIADRLDTLSANVNALQTNYTETITLCNDLKQALLKKVFG